EKPRLSPDKTERGGWSMAGASTAPKNVGETPQVPQGACGTSQTGSCISPDQRDDGGNHWGCRGGRTGEYSSFGGSKDIPSHPLHDPMGDPQVKSLCGFVLLLNLLSEKTLSSEKG
uniref:Uncharacterized protein n=1 Tax=Geospiza parvula TaxID=87175 RepID=A0A8C3NGL7_GEOPR